MSRQLVMPAITNKKARTACVPLRTTIVSWSATLPWSRVREATSHAFGDAVQLTPVPGQGTRVEVPRTEDAEAFHVVVRAAIAAAQQQEATQNQ